MSKAVKHKKSYVSVSKTRETPKDVENRGNFTKARIKGERPPKKPREPTSEEVHANNVAQFEAVRDLFDLRNWVPRFQKDLEEMNKGKKGRPFQFGDLMVKWISEVMSLLSLDFRKAAGLTAGIFAYAGLESPSYSRLYERFVMAMGAEFLIAPVTDARILFRYVMAHPGSRVRRLAIDSTGLNLSNCTMWREHKWGVGPANRGWLKMHSITDIDTNELVAVIVTTDDTGDCGMLPYLTGMLVKGDVKFDVLYGDGAYGTVENFNNVCEELGCRFVTSFKSNTRPKDLGCASRGKAARLWCSLPYKEWVKETGYGVRWKVESAFSDFKRIISEHVKARKDWRFAHEIVSKIIAFNYLKGRRADILGVTGNGIVVSYL